jgi:hypothetical protein
MDKDLLGRLRHGASPFDGTVICSPDVPIRSLRGMFAEIVAVLFERHGNAEIRICQDWSMHNGDPSFHFILGYRGADWTTLQAASTTDEALLATSSLDFGVYTVCHPTTCDFALLWLVDDDSEFRPSPGLPPDYRGMAGRVLVVGGPSLVSRLIEVMPGADVAEPGLFFHTPPTLTTRASSAWRRLFGLARDRTTNT